ncbi:ABC transporter substrate-binding protein [Vallitalea okinawensis]|uniref:ABC transporter substrate-binding protein n=1 Tax=Vallitalea okinawensis TaxID=2078660 RepID=UPI000CFB7200|nr:extracellular solute-binding protein [Vallitalea okinawensis]
MKRLSIILAIILLVSVGCTGTETVDTDSPKGGEEKVAKVDEKDKIKFSFAHFDSGEVAGQLDAMVEAYEADHPNVEVEVIAKPGEYESWIQAQMEAGTLPDVGYCSAALAFSWAEEGHVLDIAQYFDQYPTLGNRISSTYYWWEEGKTFGTNTGGETIMVYYNKDLFKENGIDLPIYDGKTTWTWDEFVDISKTLTVDVNGNNAHSSDFDKENIKQYAMKYSTWWMYYYPLILSNGVDFINEDGTDVTINDPRVVEVIEELRQYIYDDRLAPTADVSEALGMNTATMFQTKTIAMTVSGYWAHSGFGDTGVDIGVAPLPTFDPTGKAYTVELGDPTVIFNKEGRTKEELEAIVEFYEYHNNPEYVSMFRDGLWMPLQKDYYTTEEGRNKWLNDEYHDLENLNVYTTLTLEDSISAPVYRLKNWGELEREMNAHIDNIWNEFVDIKDDSEKNVQSVLDNAEKAMEPLLQGTHR